MPLAQPASRRDHPAASRSTATPPARSGSVDVLYEESVDRRLADVLAPCFALIVHLRSHQEFGDPVALRQRIKDMLAQAEQEAVGLGIPLDDAQQGIFAAVAFLDETILSSSWSQREAWMARSLQLELYDRFDAGEIFFDRLEEILQHPTRHMEVIEVFYVCMTLGFKGRYQLHQQERLQGFIERCHEELCNAPGIDVDTLAPDGRPHDQAAAEVRSKVPTWMLVAGAVVLALIVYLGLNLYATHAATDAAATIEQLIPAR